MLARWRKAAPDVEAVSVLTGRRPMPGGPARGKAVLIAGGVATWVTGSLCASVPVQAVATQALPSGCNQVSATVTCRFFYSGAPQRLQLPVGVTNLRVDLIGAAGGHGCRAFGGDLGNRGGAGAEVKGDIALPPDGSVRVLQIHVGGRGHDAQDFEEFDEDAEGEFSGAVCLRARGGHNGGGEGGWKLRDLHFDGGGGGGASDIRSGGFNLGDRLATAGGGGGGGSVGFSNGEGLNPGGAGGNGGASGQDGFPGQAAQTSILGGGGGRGATPAAGGLGGVSRGYCQGTPGVSGRLGIGGQGAPDGLDRFSLLSCGGAGGGGGGGVYGGGGGGTGDFARPFAELAGGGGGGGGSSAGPVGSSITSGVTTPDGNGTVTISWLARPRQG